MDKRDFMTAKEVAELFGYKEQTLSKNFKRTAASIKKKYNVDLVKCEKIDGIYYQIFEDIDNRALTIYDEVNDITITIESLKYELYEFYIFLAIAASPFGAFRGKREDLLKYVGIKPTKKSIQTLDSVLNSLAEKERIKWHQDEDFIIAYIKGSLQNKCSISVDILRESRRIADENHKQFNKISQLVKVWTAIRLCYENQPFTYAEISKMTGLSYKQIRDVKRLLESNDIFKTSRAGSYFLCEGMNVDLNAFFN